MELILSFIGGVVVGAAIALVAAWLHGRSTRAAMEGRFRDAFAALASEALSANSERFLTLAKESLSAQSAAGVGELEQRRQLIDKSIQQVTERLEGLRKATGDLEAARKHDVGRLGEGLQNAVQQVGQLRKTTDELRAALSHPQRRGQWGEHMADDILRTAGMIEGVNYTKQQTISETGRRPDFTFSLPNGVKLNMDVKFPLDNYLKHVAAETDSQREQLAKSFVGDVRTQVRAIASREYIDPAGGTADFALMFVPNERMFAAIQGLNSNLLAEAAQKRVLLVGPLSLLAVLAIARQAAETANLTAQADEALELLEQFTKQWAKFKDHMTRLGDKLDAAVREYQQLTTTRSNVLERPLKKLRRLRGGAEQADES